MEDAIPATETKKMGLDLYFFVFQAVSLGVLGVTLSDVYKNEVAWVLAVLLCLVDMIQVAKTPRNPISLPLGWLILAIASTIVVGWAARGLVYLVWWLPIAVAVGYFMAKVILITLVSQK